MKRASIFQRTPEGQKTPKMLDVERRLGRTLEEDFREYYLWKGWGQIRLSKRWGVQRKTVFCSSARNGFRCWAEILNLAVRGTDEQVSVNSTGSERNPTCEVCEEFETHLDRAHWISSEEGGGTQGFNTLRLCPNCHRKLDRDDPVTTERAREILLLREAKRIIETERDTATKQKDLVRVCRAIITRRTT
jgi:5-methylcytosine-specific restriction endonuclease McrA